MNNKKAFTVAVDDIKVELCIKRPTVKQRIDSQLVFNAAWRKAESAGSILRKDLDNLAEKHGLWDETKKARVTELENEIVTLERKLRAGANEFPSVETAKECALKIRKLRNERMDLLLSKNDLYVYTADYHADTARLNYLIWSCTCYNDSGKPYWSSVDDYVNDSDGEAAKQAMTTYLELMREDTAEEDSLYENVFLRKYGFANSKNQLVDKKGRLVTDDGKLINGDGKYVTESGALCDVNGYLVTPEGDYIVSGSEWKEPALD